MKAVYDVGFRGESLAFEDVVDTQESTHVMLGNTSIVLELLHAPILYRGPLCYRSSPQVKNSRLPGGGILQTQKRGLRLGSIPCRPVGCRWL